MNNLLKHTAIRRFLFAFAGLVGILVFLLLMNMVIIGMLLAVFPVSEGVASGPVVVIGALSVLGSVVLFVIAVLAVMDMVLGEEER